MESGIRESFANGIPESWTLESGQATNQYALPVLRYLMWTQHCPLSELRDVDREARKIIVENGGRHPASLTSLLCLCYAEGERGGRPAIS